LISSNELNTGCLTDGCDVAVQKETTTKTQMPYALDIDVLFGDATVHQVQNQKRKAMAPKNILEGLVDSRLVVWFISRKKFCDVSLVFYSAEPSL
jgi:hypothetical protein